MVDMMRGHNGGKKPTETMTKPRLTNKSETAKVMCGFCHKNSHVEEVCWKKKEGEKVKTKPKAPTEVDGLEVPVDDLCKESTFL